MRRVFVALPFYALFKSDFDKIFAHFKDKFQNVRWIHPEDAHLTLHFFASLTDSQVERLRHHLSEIVTGFKPMILGLHGWGCFPDEKSPRVLWLGVQGDLPALNVFQLKIGMVFREAGFAVEAREFRPHITLGRIRANSGEVDFSELKHSVLTDVLSPPRIIPFVALIESHLNRTESRYETIDQFRFAAS